MSADAFAKLRRARKPLGADTAREISANLAAIEKAGVRDGLGLQM